MYRQVLVRPEERKYQRIVWRDDDDPVRTYHLHTVTFGLSAAPYLAIRCLHQLADDEQHQYPTGAVILKRNVYVDDLLTGAQTRQEAITIQSELENLMKLGCFNLRQWASNDPTLLQGVASKDINKRLQLEDSTMLKTLGITWDSVADKIKYFVKTSNIVQLTKRALLSETAKLFNPLGLLSPAIIVAKAFIQKLWILKVDWDATLHPDLQKEWLQLYQKLWSKLHFHGEYWYQAPPMSNFLVFTPDKLQVFVSNRVGEIQQKTNIQNWRHVRTHDNPADLVSRGKTPSEFVKPSLWICGPSWLEGDENGWPNLHLEYSSQVPDLRKSQTSLETCLASTTDDKALNMGSSSITKLQRVIAQCLRFKTCRRGPPTLDELGVALQAIVHWVQVENFVAVIKELQHPQHAKHKSSELSKFAKLSPLIDKDRLLRVGGRLTNAHNSYPQRHRFILSERHPVTDHIIRNEHTLQLHAGAQATLYTVRRRVWILNGCHPVRRIVRACVKCIRHKQPPVDYTMEKKVRNRGRVKVYVSVFVCIAIKAVHLEIVRDLTTKGFRAALRRFIARRRVYSNIYSDNGTNFIGANSEPKAIHEFLKNEDHRKKILHFATSKEIRWYFIPAQSPNFGGLWEAAVKSFKHHLRRIVTNELLTHFLIDDSLTNLRGPDFRETPSNRLSTCQHIQKLKQDFWTRWHREYISGLNVKSRWTHGEHPIKEGTLVIITEDHLPPIQWALGRLIKTHAGTDGFIRAVTVKTAKGTYDRNMRKLAPLPNTDDSTC
ncbi:uncharacterized protein LOC135159927 [Diachasmimorpha longicaudata]|uniref:uncharacterized protein LOC135159927 n=1 Tax=Diachasmimorpha longicaudata TaxID=58733 RepID=UPI0030B8E2AB